MNVRLRMGWRKDLPDIRDYDQNTPSVKSVLDQSTPLRITASRLPTTVDLRKYCSPVEDQGDLGSCTANAGVGLIEYFENRTKQKFINASRLFLYKATRNLLGETGDTGAYLRTTMQAMVLFGIAPESIWPYDVNAFDNEPGQFVYAYAQNYKATQYYRLDPTGTTGPQALANVKSKLAGGLISMFGFTVYDTIYNANANGEIAFPTSKNSVLGGHAIVAVGYDDNKVISNRKGALLIRNSWGTSWGLNGYGWLPYDYVNYQLATDFWSLASANFVDTDLFR